MDGVRKPLRGRDPIDGVRRGCVLGGRDPIDGVRRGCEMKKRELRRAIGRLLCLALVLLRLLDYGNNFFPCLQILAFKLFASLREISSKQSELDSIDQSPEPVIACLHSYSRNVACMGHFLLRATTQSIDAALDKRIIYSESRKGICSRGTNKGRLGRRRQSKARLQPLLRRSEQILFFFWILHPASVFYSFYLANMIHRVSITT
jgi:hypothetical protein